MQETIEYRCQRPRVRGSGTGYTMESKHAEDWKKKEVSNFGRNYKGKDDLLSNGAFCISFLMSRPSLPLCPCTGY